MSQGLSLGHAPRGQSRPRAKRFCLWTIFLSLSLRAMARGQPPWPATIAVMADAASLADRLEQIGTQLDWVRDYL
jgi:hypothetical protein